MQVKCTSVVQVKWHNHELDSSGVQDSVGLQDEACKSDLAKNPISCIPTFTLLDFMCVITRLTTVLYLLWELECGYATRAQQEASGPDRLGEVQTKTYKGCLCLVVSAELASWTWSFQVSGTLVPSVTGDAVFPPDMKHNVTNSIASLYFCESSFFVTLLSIFFLTHSKV